MLKKGFLLALLSGLMFSAIVFVVEVIANLLLIDTEFEPGQVVTAYVVYAGFSLAISTLAVILLGLIRRDSFKSQSFQRNLTFLLWILLAGFLSINLFARVDNRLAMRGAFAEVVGAAAIFLLLAGAFLLLEHLLKRFIRQEQAHSASALALAIVLVIAATLELKALLVVASLRGALNPLSPEMLIWAADIFLIGVILFMALFSVIRRQAAPEKVPQNASILRLPRRRAALLLAVIALIGVTLFSGAIYRTQLKAEDPFTAESHAKDKPNVLLLVVDAFRTRNLKAYGYERDTLPFFDRLSERGTVFKNCVAAGSGTVPSVPSLLTSRYPSEHGTLEPGQEFREEVLSLPEILKSEGYTTACFSGNPLIQPMFNFDQGFDYFPHIKPTPRYILVRCLGSFGLSGYLHDLGLLNAGYVYPVAEKLNRYLLPWLEKNKDQSFFAYIHVMDVHLPYLPTLRHFSADFHGRSISSAEIIEMRKRGSFPLTEEQRQNIVDRYDDEILYVSAELDRILDKLEQMGIDDDTIIILTADHGEEFWEHGSMLHCHTLYNELVMVPLVISLPSSLDDRKVIEETVRTVDITPTILELTGIAARPEWRFSGISLAPVLARDEGGLSGAAIEGIMETGDKKAIIKGNLKLILTRKDEKISAELYDIEQDPYETTNMVSEMPDAARAMEESLDAYLESAATNSAAKEVGMGGEVKKQLKALGYLQ